MKSTKTTEAIAQHTKATEKGAKPKTKMRRAPASMAVLRTVQRMKNLMPHPYPVFKTRNQRKARRAINRHP
jgi:hypothetical protein